MGFGQGLSGLNAAAQELDVIGNNIANANTVGFKASTVAFGDIYATSKVGLGTKVAAVNQRFTVGTITNTGNQLDLAVDGASGMFRMQDALGNIMYTRNGQFFRDSNNFIVNAQGQRLTGFGLTGTEPRPIEIPVGNISPQATTDVSTQVNLNANAKVVSQASLAATEITGVMAKIIGPLDPAGYSFITADGKNYAVDATDATKVFLLTGNPATGVVRGDAVIAGASYDSANGELTLPGTPPPGVLAASTITVDSIRGVVDTPADYALHETDEGYYVVKNTGEVYMATVNGDPADATGEIVIDGPVNDASYTAGVSPDGEISFGTGVQFDPTDPASYTSSLPITVYDSLGNPVQLTQYFVKRSALEDKSVWSVYYVIPDTTASTDPYKVVGSAKMLFDTSGSLRSITNPDGAETANNGKGVKLTISDVGGSGSPARNLDFSINYTGSTSFGGEFSYNFAQNGYPTGDFSNIEIGQDGAITAAYTNGERQTVGYVALATFNNLNGLQPAGDNAWVETGASGQSIIGRPGTNGLALIRGASVEESNVDMSQELVRMIISQRFYQANAQTIKTQDQILQTLITMR